MNPLYVGIDENSRNNVNFFMKPDGTKSRISLFPTLKAGARKLVKEMLVVLTSFALTDVIIGIEVTSV